MKDAQLLMLLLGLAVNFIGLVIGIVGLAFKVGRDLTAMRAEIGERLARVETHVQNLREDRGGQHGKLRRQAG